MSKTKIVLFNSKKVTEKLVENNYKQQLVATQLVSECKSPPEGLFSSWKTEYYFDELKFYSGMQVAYECDDAYEFKPDQNAVLNCQSDGTWSSSHAPECAQSLRVFCLLFL